MKFTESKKSSDQVVDLTNCKAHAVHDSLAMLLHWGRAGTEVTPVGEVSLGLRVDHQHPVRSYWLEYLSRHFYTLHTAYNYKTARRDYLDRASPPMSAALPLILAQKALTVALSLAVRLILFSCFS